jgi:serine/threonine-protein kinase
VTDERKPVDDTAPASPKAVRPREDQFPKNWARYSFEGFLGEGAMGAVFKARDRVLGRLVAVKLVHGHQSDPVGEERFQREASAQARIDHPHVCKVYEVGEIEGRPFIAMQLIEGKTLAGWNEELNLQEKLRVLQQVSEALTAAHAIGIVHRDLKPTNIMCERRSDGSLHPYVMDFGLARDPRDATLTGTDAVIGTPTFMSPEQARGDHGLLDARSDVYALGATLYALLCGQPPFIGESVTLVLMRVFNEPAKPVRQRAPSVPLDVETITMKCLEKSPARRYGSARALAEDLANYLSGRPIVARPPSRGYRLRLLILRNRAVAVVAAAALLSTLALVGWVVKVRLDARRLAALAERFGGVATEIEQHMRLAALLPEHDINIDRRALSKRLTALEEEVARAGPIAEGTGHHAIGRGLLALGELEAARAELERAWAAGDRRPEVAAALGNVWERLWERDRDEASREGADPDDKKSERSARARTAEWLKLARGAPHLDAELLEAKIDYVEERMEAARDRAREVFKRDPLLYEALLLEGRADSKLGHKLAGKGKLAEARRHYADADQALTQASRIARSDPEAQYQLCRLYDRMLELAPAESGWLRDDAAVEACRRAALVDPTSDAAQGKLAIAINRQAEQPGTKNVAALLDESQHAAELAWQLAPRFVNHYRVLANTFRLKRDYDAANAAIDRGLHADPDAKSAEKLLLMRAQVEVARGRDQLAHHQPASGSLAEARTAIDQARAHGGGGDDYRVLQAVARVEVLAVGVAAAENRDTGPPLAAARAALASLLAVTHEETPFSLSLAAELDRYRK